jgi:putative DNA primase/helicase
MLQNNNIINNNSTLIYKHNACDNENEQSLDSENENYNDADAQNNENTVSDDDKNQISDEKNKSYDPIYDAAFESIGEVATRYPEEAKKLQWVTDVQCSHKGITFSVVENVNTINDYGFVIYVFFNGIHVHDELWTYNDYSTPNSMVKTSLAKRINELSNKDISSNDAGKYISEFVNTLRTSLDSHFKENKKIWESINNKVGLTPHIKQALLDGDSSYFVDERNNVLVDVVGDYLISKYHIKTVSIKDGARNKIIYHYENGVYRLFGEDKIRFETQKMLTCYSSKRNQDEVVNYIKTATMIRPNDFICDPYIINFKNGLYYAKTCELKPHTPDLLSTIQFNVEYNPEATCPIFNKFIHEVLPDDDDRMYVLEYLGYTLLPYMFNCYQKSLILLGLPGTGKGTLLDVANTMLGAENVSTVTLQEIDSDKFASHQLVGKVANISDDLPKDNMSKSSNFQSIICGKPVSVQDKGQSRYDCRIFAKIISSANNLPYAPMNKNDAYFRRFIIVEMNQVFKNAETEDPHLYEKMTTPEELSGIMNILIRHLQTVIKNDKLSYNKSTEDIKLLYGRQQNPMQAFIEECTSDTDELGFPPLLKQELFDTYELWCKTHNIKNELSYREFNSKISPKSRKSSIVIENLSDIRLTSGINKDKMAWVNIRLNTVWAIKIKNHKKEIHNKIKTNECSYVKDGNNGISVPEIRTLQAPTQTPQAVDVIVNASLQQYGGTMLSGVAGAEQMDMSEYDMEHPRNEPDIRESPHALNINNKNNLN